MSKKLLCTVLLAVFLGITVLPAQGYELLSGPTGVIRWNKDKAFDGYTLFSPMLGKTSYLIDMEGNIVHKWETNYRPGLYAELLPNGNLLRGARPDNPPVQFGGRSGLIQEIDWNGQVVWEFKNHSPSTVHHHAFSRMPNGNTLVLAWEYKSYEEAIAKGRNPNTISKEGFEFDGKIHMGLWPDYIQEVNKAGKVVWEWHAWDHIGTGPNQLDINFKLPKAATYLSVPDWNHMNSLDYIKDTDQILLNSRNFGEFYFINHKTGAIEYRWGNPCAYGKGRCPSFDDDGDQQLFGPHHATGLPNGHILVFDNGWKRPEGNRSRAVEMDPKTGNIVWQFASKVGASFYTAFQGSAQRLPNGNTLITSTGAGHVFEVTGGVKPEIVWEYVTPMAGGKAKCFLDDQVDTLDPTEETMFNMIHRAYRYAKDYPGLAGKDLSKKEKFVEGCPEMWKLIGSSPR